MRTQQLLQRFQGPARGLQWGQRWCSGGQGVFFRLPRDVVYTESFWKRVVEFKEAFGIVACHDDAIAKALTYDSAYTNPNRQQNSALSLEQVLEDKMSLKAKGLAFIGDSVLGLLTNTYLIEKMSIMDPGTLHQKKITLVSNKMLSRVFRKHLNLGGTIVLDQQFVAVNDSSYVEATAVEAIIGALYLQCGFQEASRFVNQHILPQLVQYSDPSHTEKQRPLHELTLLLQRHFKCSPLFETRTESLRHSDIHHVTLVLNKKPIARCTSKNLQVAKESLARFIIKSKKEFIRAALQDNKFKLRVVKPKGG